MTETTPNTPGSLAGHVHLWPTALGMTRACHCGLDAFDYIATLEARLEAAERALLGLVQDNERGVRSAFYYRARRVLGFKPGESALTRPATAAEQEGTTNG